ncbi:MAG: glycosyltransferase [Propionibacteriaceae bacterium]|jgi:glycosyltransferase involved in cell wall biosynthesis|nr:glycosyltransferase [Propionibacteriaceae bacterium]
MTIDVLFPFYGDVALMKAAVRSVLGQYDRDLRLVVVDDGYPDDSIPGWFESLGDDRVEYHRNEHNLGANGNYRKALTYVKNDLVVVMGADDIMLPNYTEWLRQAAAAHPKADIFQPGVVVIDENGAAGNGLTDSIKAVLRPRGHGVRVLSGERIATSLLRGDWLYFPSLGWRAEAILSNSFREGYDVVQDLMLVMDIIMKGGSLLLDDALAFCYRRHSGSDSSVRAVAGSRFAEERRAFLVLADETQKLGWNHAARVARLHLSSRLHAASLAPKALLTGNREGIRNLSSHVIH